MAVITLQRRHFQFLADLMADVLQDLSRPQADRAEGIRREAVEAMARTLADRLQTTNGRFNRSRFLQACGITSGR